jgi:hypothetical protein
LANFLVAVMAAVLYAEVTTGGPSERADYVATTSVLLFVTAVVCGACSTTLSELAK